VKITDILSKIKPNKTKGQKLVMDQIYTVPPDITIDDHFNYTDKEHTFAHWKRCQFVKYKGGTGKWDSFYPHPDDGSTNFYLNKGVWNKKVKPIKEVKFVHS